MGFCGFSCTLGIFGWFLGYFGLICCVIGALSGFWGFLGIFGYFRPFAVVGLGGFECFRFFGCVIGILLAFGVTFPFMGFY